MTSTNPHHSYGEEEQFENEHPQRDAFGNTWSGVVGTHYREVYHHNPRQPMRSSARNPVEEELPATAGGSRPGRAAGGL
ncbi:MAG TPA: hypothetical protein VHR39_09650 [Propionibacteriaceae bacterium]|nr:hypothetical protein [Propionibacteriaceae bacterium]